MSFLKNHAWKIALAFFLLDAIPYFALARGSWPGSGRTDHAWYAGLAYNLSIFITAGCILLGAYLWKPRNRTPWYFLAAAHAMFAFGLTYEAVANGYQLGQPGPVWKVGDLFWLGWHPYLFTSLVLFTWDRDRSRDQTALLDAIIIGVGLSAPAVAYAFTDNATDFPFGAVVKDCLYTSFFLVNFVACVRLVLTAGRWTPLYVVLLCSFFGLVLGEVGASKYGIADRTTMARLTYDLPYFLFWTTAAVVALHPRMTEIQTAHTPVGIVIAPKWRVVLISVVGLVPFVALVLADRWPPYLEIAALIVYVCFALRMRLSYRDYARTVRVLQKRGVGLDDVG